LALHRHEQCREGQLNPHVIAHCLANHFMNGKIENDGEIKPSFAGGNVAQVGESNTIGRRCLEALGKKARRNRKKMSAVRDARPEAAPCTGVDVMAAHEALEASTTALVALCLQGGMHSWAAIAAMVTELERRISLTRMRFSAARELSGRHRQA
jgi:hypothetical protein